jgi:hypothetical protein
MPKLVKWQEVVRHGRVVGRIEVFWSLRLRKWVSVPGVSKYESSKEVVRLRSLISKFGEVGDDNDDDGPEAA